VGRILCIQLGMKTIHGLLLLVILALLGMLGLLRSVEGFADGGTGPSGPVMLPSKPPAMKNEMAAKPTFDTSYTPDYKGMALSSLESMKQACNSMASVETYLKQETVLPTQMAPTQMPTPPPVAKQLGKSSPALNQGKKTQLNKPTELQGNQEPLLYNQANIRK